MAEATADQKHVCKTQECRVFLKINFITVFIQTTPKVIFMLGFTFTGGLCFCSWSLGFWVFNFLGNYTLR